MKILLIAAASIVPAVAFAETFENLYVNGNARLGTFGGTLQTIDLNGNVKINEASSYFRGPGSSSSTPGPSTIAVGNGSWAGGYSSSAFGYNAWAYGHYSTALGVWPKSCYGELVIGQYNDTTGNSATADDQWNAADPVFTIGFGTSDTARANAFRIFKNGNMLGNGADNRLPMQLTLPDVSSILTRQLGDSRYFSSLTGQISLGQYSTPDVNAALIVGNGTISTPANSLKLMKNGGIQAASLTTSGNASVQGNLSASKTYTDTAQTEQVSRSTAMVNPSYENIYRTIALQGRAHAIGTQNLTRSLSLAGGLNGVEGQVINEGSGAVTAAVAVTGAVQNTSTGITTNAVALMGRTPTASSSGLITTAYGLYLQDQKTASVTGNGYGIFAAGTDNLNVLAGRVRVGSESNPATGIELDVAGDAAFSGNAAVTGQVVVGSWEVADANAAIIVGNGTDTNNRANSFVVKKDGAVEVATVVRVPASGDISMGAFN